MYFSIFLFELPYLFLFQNMTETVHTNAQYCINQCFQVPAMEKVNNVYIIMLILSDYKQHICLISSRNRNKSSLQV